MKTYSEIGLRLRGLAQEVGKVVVGKEAVLERVTLALAAKGHLLMEDVPGLAKTLTVRSFAQALGLPFGRVQFTPDLLPADISGSFYFDLQKNHFELRKGPIFTNFLLADEINRAPPKTQSALLEAMQEHQVTIEGRTHKLPAPFFVFATQNPIEQEGTYPLPEAQLDRFLMRVSVGYPSPVAEVEMLRRLEARKGEEPTLSVVMTPDELRHVQHAVDSVRVDEANKEYMVRLVSATRSDDRVALGASPRGSIALYKLAKAHAVLRGRGYVIPDDVKAIAPPALAHRLILHGEARVRGIDASTVIHELLKSVPTPPPPPVTATLPGT